jgi:hypothetical protein
MIMGNSKFEIRNTKQILLFNHLTNYHLIDFRYYLGFRYCFEFRASDFGFKGLEV